MNDHRTKTRSISDIGSIARTVVDADRDGREVGDPTRRRMDRFDDSEWMRVAAFREGARYERETAYRLPGDPVAPSYAQVMAEEDEARRTMFRCVVTALAILVAALVLWSWWKAPSFGVQRAEAELALSRGE